MLERSHACRNNLVDVGHVKARNALVASCRIRRRLGWLGRLGRLSLALVNDGSRRMNGEVGLRNSHPHLRPSLGGMLALSELCCLFLS